MNFVVGLSKIKQNPTLSLTKVSKEQKGTYLSFLPEKRNVTLHN